MKLLIAAFFYLFIITHTFAQKGINIGIQLNGSPSSIDTKKIESSNNLCITHALNSQSSELFCRIDITNEMGFKIGITPKNRAYLTTMTTDSGLKSVYWSTRTIVVPIGFYYNPTSTHLYYVLFGIDGMLIPKNSTIQSSSDDVEIPFHSHQTTDWGGILNGTSRLGFHFTPKSSLELSINFDFQINGRKQVTNSYLIPTKHGIKEMITDQILQKNPNVDLYFYYAITYVYKFTLKSKNTDMTETIK
jgi:hypothetical protein